MFTTKKIIIFFIPVLMLFLTVGCGKDTSKEIKAGQPFKVSFDKFDVDLGTISAGSTFEVQLMDGKFVATGIPKGGTSRETYSYALKESGKSNRISVWGAEFEYDSNNNLLLNNKIIGRLVLKEK